MNIITIQFMTTLHVACARDLPSLVLQLLTPSSPTTRCLDHFNSDGLTPLHIASQTNHLHVVKILLSRGAGVKKFTRRELTALHLAAQVGAVADRTYRLTSWELDDCTYFGLGSKVLYLLQLGSSPQWQTFYHRF